MTGNDIRPGQGAPDEILRERKRRIFSWRTLVFLLVSLSLAYLLLRQMDFAGTMDMIRKADPLLIAACCAVYFLSNFFKMLRFRVMLERLPHPALRSLHDHELS